MSFVHPGNVDFRRENSLGYLNREELIISFIGVYVIYCWIDQKWLSSTQKGLFCVDGFLRKLWCFICELGPAGGLYLFERILVRCSQNSDFIGKAHTPTTTY